MTKNLIYFFIGFIIIGIASFFLPQAAMSFGNYGITIIVVAFTILVLFITFVVQKLVKNGLNSDQIPNGIPATATVISSQQGNFKLTFGGVQEIYQLIIEATVQNRQGETWPARIKAMIPITQISTFQPGVSFLVKYDPQNKKRVVIDKDASSEAAEVNVPGYDKMTHQSIMAAKQNAPKDITLRLEAATALLQELRLSGVSATATVLSNDIIYANYLPYNDAVQLKLQVNATDRPSFEAMILGLFANTALPKVEVGKTVYVKYDRNNPQRLTMTGTDQPDTVQNL